MIVRADADVRKAAEIAVRGSFTNAGQLCISMERIYVHDAVYDTFVAALCDRVAALEFATGIGWGGTIGMSISPENGPGPGARGRRRPQGHACWPAAVRDRTSGRRSSRRSSTA